ncbi:hypothetical protein DVK85_03500 [Flavobacterium arcticum]|uniref:Uncharacterized protein n=1 Tax=Flavobacterium arcticum TaxID=1784713 RepID=A0A345H9T5_9FLAO|nr:hypothetical protein DVK85_03500 [Flavobacterium arcticum]
MIFPSLLFAQDYDCLKESTVENNFYIKGNKLYNGYVSGEIDLYIEIKEHLDTNPNSLALFIYTEDKVPLVGATCNNIIRVKNDRRPDKSFKLKKLLPVSDKQGIMIIPHDMSLELISITYPSFNAEVIDYKRLIECVKNN